MFKKSFLLVALIITLVFGSAFTTQMVLTNDLPSSYDPGLRIDKAMRTAKTPLLVEFYSDTCGTCKRMAPIVHELMEDYGDRLTLVMLDINEPENMQIAQLFGVKDLPGLFIFDAKHMKKHKIDPKDFVSKATVQHAIDRALNTPVSRRTAKI